MVTTNRGCAWAAALALAIVVLYALMMHAQSRLAVIEAENIAKAQA